MNNEKLEHYLQIIDKSLTGIPVSEKAEIITEIKSHVLSALEKDPKTHIESILSSLGEPQQVASRYLLERNLKPHKYRLPLTPIVKWLVIGFLGTLIIVTISGSLLIWKLKPTFNFNGQTGNIEMLNGAIRINFNNETADNKINLANRQLLCGNYQITAQSTLEDLRTYCKIATTDSDLEWYGWKKEAKFHADDGSYVKCEFVHDTLKKCKFEK
jgi:hypothetical protein